MPSLWTYYLGKTLHVSAYAFLAATACWLPAPRVGRAVVWGALLAHAAVTEALQVYVARGSEFSDFLLNSVGVVTGVVIGLVARNLVSRRCGD